VSLKVITSPPLFVAPVAFTHRIVVEVAVVAVVVAVPPDMIPVHDGFVTVKFAPSAISKIPVSIVLNGLGRPTTEILTTVLSPTPARKTVDGLKFVAVAAGGVGRVG
jgi:hypothetical protein